MFPSYPPSFADCISVCWRADICVSSPYSSVAAIAPRSAEREHAGTCFTFCSFPDLQRFDILKLRDIFSFSFFFLLQMISLSCFTLMCLLLLRSTSCCCEPQSTVWAPCWASFRERVPLQVSNRETGKEGVSEDNVHTSTEKEMKNCKCIYLKEIGETADVQCFMSMTCTAVESNCKWIYSKSGVFFFYFVT